jgi:RNA polymerase sigma factor, sigma-70 family
MNKQLIIDMARPYVKDGFITYEEFDHIYEMLSLKEKYAVVDILYNNGIDLIDADEQADGEKFVLDMDDDVYDGSEDEAADDKFEVLYDDGLFRDTGFKSQKPEPVVVNKDVKQSNEILCVMIQQGNLQAEQDLCVKNKKLVDKYVLAYEKRYRHRLDFDDLEQAGFIGLITAAKKFDISMGYSFSTYAVWWIKQAITREIMDHGFVIRIPVHMMERISKVATIENRFSELNREERIVKVMDETGYKEERVRECMMLKEYVLTYSSLNVTVGEDETVELGEFLSDDGVIPIEEMVENRELRRILDDVLDTLTEKEKKVIRLRFGLEDNRHWTLEEVGKLFNVTRERIRQIESKALRKLRHPSRLHNIKSFLE